MTERLTLLVHHGMVRFLNSLVLMLADGLREISIEPEILQELPSGFSGRAIVLGANFFELTTLQNCLKSNSIILNIENSSSKFLNGNYNKMLREFAIWDYNKENAEVLSRNLVRPIHYLKTFYVECLSRLQNDTEEEFDVLFYGSFNARRQEILNQLRTRGLVVHAVFGVFGAELDYLIARSKMVINIHYYDNGRLEMIRLFDLLANGRAVVSELNSGELIDDDLADALVTAPYDGLVDATEALVRDDERRDRVAKAGFAAFSRRRADVILREALAWSDQIRPPADAILGSGKMYDAKAFNIDKDDRWHPDIVADIADPELFSREFQSPRFGALRLQRGWFDSVTASHILEHVPDLVTTMTNCLALLTDGGLLRVTVPYDLSYGAWQDPTHVRAFNERSWLYYCEWYWYLGWSEARFDLIEQRFGYSPLGDALTANGMPQEEILRSPRAVDEMSVVLRKRWLTDEERTLGENMRGENRRQSESKSGS
jgi:SAM-dependent methyltransferase